MGDTGGRVASGQMSSGVGACPQGCVGGPGLHFDTNTDKAFPWVTHAGAGGGQRCTFSFLQKTGPTPLVGGGLLWVPSRPSGLGEFPAPSRVEASCPVHQFSSPAWVALGANEGSQRCQADCEGESEGGTWGGRCPGAG